MELIIMLVVVFGFTLLGAVTQNPITGRTKNKFGPAVFSKWKDLNTMRTKPVSVANPNTIAQQNARGSFAFMSKMARDLQSWLEYGFDTFYSSMTRRNAFLKVNTGKVTFVNGVFDDWDIADTVFRTGRNPQTGATIQIAATPAAVTVDFSANYPAAYATGKVDVIVINAVTYELIGQATLTNPIPNEVDGFSYIAGKAPTAGQTLLVSYSFRTADNSEVDNSVNIVTTA